MLLVSDSGRFISIQPLIESSYFVLASAFNSNTSSVQWYFDSAHIPTVLGRATSNSYICCPPKILEILYAASQLSNVSVEDEDSTAQVASAGSELLKQAQSVDVPSWAAESIGVSDIRDKALESRINAGFAHQLAACLYIVQAIEPVGDLFGNQYAIDLDSAMIDRLSKIPPEDPNFKATTWPTFIVGAGTRDPERRAWVMERLQALVRCCPWGFLHTAMETLQVIWRLEGPECGERSWVHTLKDPRLNFLMV